MGYRQSATATTTSANDKLDRPSTQSTRKAATCYEVQSLTPFINDSQGIPRMSHSITRSYGYFSIVSDYQVQERIIPITCKYLV